MKEELVAKGLLNLVQIQGIEEVIFFIMSPLGGALGLIFSFSFQGIYDAVSVLVCVCCISFLMEVSE